MTELGADVEPFMLHVYAALAEKERALISERTKAALQGFRSHIDDFVGSYNTRAAPFVWTKAVVHQKRLKPRLSDL